MQIAWWSRCAASSSGGVEGHRLEGSQGLAQFMVVGEVRQGWWEVRQWRSEVAAAVSGVCCVREAMRRLGGGGAVVWKCGGGEGRGCEGEARWRWKWDSRAGRWRGEGGGLSGA